VVRNDPKHVNFVVSVNVKLFPSIVSIVASLPLLQYDFKLHPVFDDDNVSFQLFAFNCLKSVGHTKYTRALRNISPN